ncbi:MAG: hypothetical protein IT558_03740 [Alphaproteobacteria bacterium]|nr:hypothetical protein [Alphaproteobacteria bacterium]
MKDEFSPPEPLPPAELSGEHLRHLENSIRILLNVKEPTSGNREQACDMLRVLVTASDTSDLHASSVAALQRLCKEPLVLKNFVQMLASEKDDEIKDFIARAMEMGKPPPGPGEPYIQ